MWSRSHLILSQSGISDVTLPGLVWSQLVQVHRALLEAEQPGRSRFPKILVSLIMWEEVQLNFRSTLP